MTAKKESKTEQKQKGLILPEEVAALLKSFEETRAKVSAKWPKGLDSVEAVRRERR